MQFVVSGVFVSFAKSPIRDSILCNLCRRRCGCTFVKYHWTYNQEWNAIDKECDKSCGFNKQSGTLLCDGAALTARVTLTYIRPSTWLYGLEIMEQDRRGTHQSTQCLRQQIIHRVQIHEPTCDCLLFYPLATLWDPFYAINEYSSWLVLYILTSAAYLPVPLRRPHRCTCIGHRHSDRYGAPGRVVARSTG